MSKILVGTKPYVANSFRADAVGYAGPNQTAVLKDSLVQRATLPKPTSAFSGVSRASSKFTRTFALVDATTTSGDCISEISWSVPVGTKPSDLVTFLDDVKAYVATAEFRALVSNGMVAVNN